MTKRKRTSKPSFNITGRIDAGIVNLGGTQNFQAPIILNMQSHLQNATQSIQTMPNADQSSKDELIHLVDQLKEQLEKVPLEKEEEAEKISKHVEALLKEANQKQLDERKVKITSESLKKATESLATVMPAVMVIATQIVSQVLKIVR